VRLFSFEIVTSFEEPLKILVAWPRLGFAEDVVPSSRGRREGGTGGCCRMPFRNSYAL